MNMVITTMNTDAPPACPGPVVGITDASFAECIECSPTPVLLAFCVTNCSACDRLLALLESAASRTGSLMMIAKADLDESPELAARLGIVSAPAVLLLNRGTVGYQFVGDLSRQELDELLAHAVGNHSLKVQYH